MELSLESICRALDMQSAHIIASNDFSARQAHLRAPALWVKDEAMHEELCYVLPATQLGEGFRCPPRSSLIVVGQTDDTLLRSLGVDALVLETASKRPPFNAIFNRITQLFANYQNWAQQLSETLAKPPSLQEIVALGEDFFGNPVLVFDRNFCLLSKCDFPVGIEWALHPRTQERMLPPEIIELIRARSSRGEFGRSFLISEEYLPHNVRFLHFNRSNTIFTVAVPELTAPLRTLTDDALQYLAHGIHNILSKSNFHSGHNLRFEEFVKKLLSNEQIEQAVVEQYLLSMRWLNNEHYLCAAFEINRWDRASSVYHSVCTDIESRFSQSFAFLHDDHIIALFNLDKSPLPRETLVQRLTLFLREHLLRVGISYVFFDFSTVVSYYKQAAAALEMGHLYAPDLWCYKFEDYVLPYFMHYGTSRINGRHLCHPGLVRLYQYDRANGTELLATLQEYLTSGLNATATAKQLFIHRNTFYQRLEKIDQLIGADLSDPNVRLFMLMSYSFVDLLRLKPVEEILAKQSTHDPAE